MKDSRFTELLNLYIDRQISATETAELEAEMQASPRRRALYRQYCQMHRATKAVYESFRLNAVEPQAGPAAGGGVIADFESQRQRRRFRWVNYAGGFVAAAAVVALAFVRFNPAAPAPVPGQELAQVAPQPASEAAALAAPAPEVVAVELPPGPTSLRNLAAVEPNYADMLRTQREEDKRAYENGQILTVRANSLFDDGVFETQQVLPAGSPRVYRSRQGPDAKVETTAWQFQR